MNKAQFFYSRLKTQLRYLVWIKLKRNYPENVDRLKAIFIHVPKTAGTSIYDLIGYTYIGHVPYDWYKSRNSVKYDTYFKFSVVRNPWDRLVSTYVYLKKGGNNAMDNHWAKKNLSMFSSFDDFVKKWVTEENVQSWMHFIPQHQYIFDNNDNIQVDYIAKFENLSDDFEVISDRLNLQRSLPHVNAGKRKPYQEYYTEETKDIVSSVYAKDVQLFDYEFE
ncbi:MAG: sulfotransferase family 2 domain-containing protein [Cyanobacteria bacterium J06634_5]